MPKHGYESVTIKSETLRTLQQISEQIKKTVPETITILANLFSRYIGFLKALEGDSPPTTEDMLAIIETMKIQTAGEPSKVEASEKSEVTDIAVCRLTSQDVDKALKDRMGKAQSGGA